MGKQKLLAITVLLAGVIFYSSCQKEAPLESALQEEMANMANKGVNSAANKAVNQQPPYDLNVMLWGEGNRMGHLKFRQDPDPDKIIELDIKVHHLEPNHAYLLQRAVDAINVVDGNCTSTSWLTLGHGLTPKSILTDESGKGSEVLWRDISMVPAGSTFDIHFRVVDATTMAVVLDGDCYAYTVR